VTKIGEAAFIRCSSLSEVTIPPSVAEIGPRALGGCSGLQRVVMMQPGVVGRVIGDCAFADCSALESIVIPDTVTKIGGVAFEGCSSLKDLVIPASASNIGWRDVAGDRELVSPVGLETLSAGWFSGWPFLSRVVIPDGVKMIGGRHSSSVRTCVRS
jgi:hypothetical protein